MKQIIGIIDYGYTGNIFNIKKAIEAIDKNVSSILVKTGPELKKADKIILPGVGSYIDAMKGISKIEEVIKETAMKKPTLGICLGMQILSEKGYEFGETKGLGLIEGEVMRLAVKYRVPHLGWACLDTIKKSKILKGITQEDNFYFMHSYELYNFKDVVSLSQYEEHKFVSSIEKDYIFGVQFHPEKSRLSGLKIFKNFFKL